MCNNLKPIYWGKITGSVIENPFTLLWSDFWRHSCHSEDLGAIALKPRLVRDFSSHDQVGNALNYQQQWAWPALSRLPQERGKMTGNKNSGKYISDAAQVDSDTGQTELQRTPSGGEHFRLCFPVTPVGCRLRSPAPACSLPTSRPPSCPLTPPALRFPFFPFFLSALSLPSLWGAYALKSWKKWFSLFILL